MRISSDTSSLQILRAQQAWEARKLRQTPKAETQSAKTDIQISPTVRHDTTAPEIEYAGNASTEKSLSPLSAQGQWGQTVQEIQSIAQRAGYIGVTEQDIRRAYTLGESLLADYRI